MASPLITEAPSAAVPVILPPPDARPVRGRFLPALAVPLTTGALLYLSYFPLSWGWLAWFALVPLFGLVRSTWRPRVLYLGVMLAGWASYLASLYWMRVADLEPWPPRMASAWVFLSFYCSLYWMLGLRLLRYFDQRTRLPLVVTAPVVWVALEFFRSNFGPGFSWYLLGYSQHNFLPIIQIADLAGVYGVSLLVAAVNGLFTEVLLARAGWFRTFVGAVEEAPQPSRFAFLVRALGVFALLMATLGYGAWRLSQDVRTPGPRVALIQGNLDQRLRNQSSDPNASQSDRDSAAEQSEYHFITLCNLANWYGPDLIVWPESSYPAVWEDIADDVPPEQAPLRWRQRHELARRFARDYVAQHWMEPHERIGRTPPAILFGMNSVIFEAEGEQRYNSAILIGRHGQNQGRYDKIHRVPLGEYIPCRTWLPFLNYFAPYDFEYTIAEGRGHTRFPLGKDTFGVVICYEDTIPYVNRPYGGGDGQPPADFVLNISNDGWFNGSHEHQEHLALCRFRAIENRRTYARAVNMGISAVIDGNGRVLRPRDAAPPANWPMSDGQRPPQVWVVDPQAEELPVSEWGRYKKVSGVMLATLPLDRRWALYPLVGDWLPWLCWLTLASCIGVTTWQRFRHRHCSTSAGSSG
jgi:apolipoprotein N-acyltransferase